MPDKPRWKGVAFTGSSSRDRAVTQPSDLYDDSAPTWPCCLVEHHEVMFPWLWSSTLWTITELMLHLRCGSQTTNNGLAVGRALTLNTQPWHQIVSYLLLDCQWSMLACEYWGYESQLVFFSLSVSFSLSFIQQMCCTLGNSQAARVEKTLFWSRKKPVDGNSTMTRSLSSSPSYFRDIT